MKPIVRDSTDADVPAIAAIYQHAVRTGTASFELTPPTTEEFAARRAVVLAGGFPYLIAEFENQPIGYAYASTYRARPGYRFTVENSVYVAPGQQGRGVGKALLPVLIDRCETLGYRLMVAVIGDSANHASINLHRACGFTDAGMLPAIGWKFDRWLDSILMTRALGPGANESPIPGR
ncbi:MAG: GNAT family N-acetyltransferase [Alphaproteobacteria bacterium]|nr:GNAT family N-acetyltransferase [Alphaproteobacteria bacterium]